MDALRADLICAVDVGTSGAKAAVFDGQGSCLASAHRPCSGYRPAPDQFLQPVEGMRVAMVETLAEAMEGLGDRVGSVVVSSQRATFGVVDEDMTPVTDWISWQDHRGVAQCQQLAERFGAAAFYELTGLPIEPTAAISKLMWLREHDPRSLRAGTRVVSHQALLLHQLGAEGVVCSYSDASYLGLFDLSRRSWSAELCGLAGVDREQLGRAVASGTVVGAVPDAVARFTGLRPGTAIIVGGGDLQCGAVGVGSSGPGLLTVGLGTGGHCVAYADRPVFHPDRAVSCQAHVLPDAWEVEGIALSTGSTFDWLAGIAGGQHQGGSVHDDLIQRASRAPAGSNGLLCLPMLNGAGAPDWDPAAAGALLGVRLHHGADEIVRAVMEGICMELRRIKESMDGFVDSVDQVRVWGGPARSPFWTGLVADVFGVPVYPEAAPHTGLLGAAVIAAVATGEYDSFPAACAAMVPEGAPCEPDAERTGVYEETFARYTAAVEGRARQDAASSWATSSAS